MCLKYGKRKFNFIYLFIMHIYIIYIYIQNYQDPLEAVLGKPLMTFNVICMVKHESFTNTSNKVNHSFMVINK